MTIVRRWVFNSARGCISCRQRRRHWHASSNTKANYSGWRSACTTVPDPPIATVLRTVELQCRRFPKLTLVADGGAPVPPFPTSILVADGGAPVPPFPKLKS